MQVRENIRSRVNIQPFIALFQPDIPIFIAEKNETYLTLSYLSVMRCTQPNFFPQFFYVVTKEGKVPLLDYVTLIFYRIGAQLVHILSQTNSLIKGLIYYQTKIWHTRSNFHSDFLSRIKNQAVCWTFLIYDYIILITDTKPITSLHIYSHLHIHDANMYITHTNTIHKTFRKINMYTGYIYKP